MSSKAGLYGNRSGHRSSAPGVTGPRFEIAYAQDEGQAATVLLRDRERARNRRSEAAKARVAAAEKAKITLPTLRWLADD